MVYTARTQKEVFNRLISVWKLCLDVPRFRGVLLDIQVLDGWNDWTVHIRSPGFAAGVNERRCCSNYQEYEDREHGVFSFAFVAHGFYWERYKFERARFLVSRGLYLLFCPRIFCYIPVFLNQLK